MVRGGDKEQCGREWVLGAREFIQYYSRKEGLGHVIVEKGEEELVIW